MSSDLVIHTIGHSNTPLAVLTDALIQAEIQLLADVRQFPASRRNPQFNSAPLAAALAELGIDYVHLRFLGGRRAPSGDSPNTALRDAGFRGFADYMLTSEFDIALAELLALAATKRTAIMCAEAVPWRCHRTLISDALTARGITVEHIYGGAAHPHQLSPHARVADARVTYPALL
jgi:uncharacterized protein (DUF488 family)